MQVKLSTISWRPVNVGRAGYSIAHKYGFTQTRNTKVCQNKEIHSAIRETRKNFWRICSKLYFWCICVRTRRTTARRELAQLFCPSQQLSEGLRVEGGYLWPTSKKGEKAVGAQFVQVSNIARRPGLTVSDWEAGGPSLHHVWPKILIFDPDPWSWFFDSDPWSWSLILILWSWSWVDILGM